MSKKFETYGDLNSFGWQRGSTLKTRHLVWVNHRWQFW